MSEAEKVNIRRWEQPFRSERDIIESFATHIDTFLQMTEGIDTRFRREVEGLIFAQKKHQDYIQGNVGRQGTNVFLMPAVIAAPAIVTTFRQQNRPGDAFWVSNIFGELCKVLMPIARDPYQGAFEHLYMEACYAISDSWRINNDNQWINNEIGEISRLATHLKNICTQNALGTFFNGRDRKYYRAVRLDVELGERVENETLTRHFDKRLRFLLENDRPHVKEYVRANMPTIYRLKIAEEWAANTRKEWERLLKEAGYDDEIRLLKDMGDLISADEVGKVDPDRRNNVRRASENNDFNRVCELLAESARELKAYLYAEAQIKLDYRQPEYPILSDGEARKKLSTVQNLSRTDDPDKARTALGIAQEVWQREISNLDLRDWVAYLQARTGNSSTAQQLFEQVQKRRAPKRNFATDWNLAVLAYNRQDEAGAYALLVPLLDIGHLDEDLVMVTLALSLKLDDRARFLAIVPQTLSLRYHPLALITAHGMGETDKAEELLAQLLRHWQANWELPSVHTRFDSFNDFEQTVNRAIVEGQLDQVVAWLEARIKVMKGYIPNYSALARVLEQEVQDVEGAFKALRDQCEQVRKKTSRTQRDIDDAYREILELCKRCKNNSLGQQAYQMARAANASDDLLRSFQYLAPVIKEDDPKVDEVKQLPAVEPLPLAPPSLRDSQLPERLAWVTARLTRIRSVASYAENSQAIEEFGKIVSEMHPHESSTVVEIIGHVTALIGTFSNTNADNRDALRVLHDRTTSYETRLSQLIVSGALPKSLADVITPFHEALKQVVGDQSRRSGIGPDIHVTIENPFISLAVLRSTLVLRVTNRSERVVNDVLIEVHIENPVVMVTGKRERRIGNLEARRSHLVSFPIERNSAVEMDIATNVNFGISLRASAEGFPNVDLGIIKQQIPIRTLSDAIGVPQIPKLFQIGQPLKPSEPQLFHGRGDILIKMKSSFYGDIQRERYFLDGIRRAGKTSVLNFLPLSLPERLTPVLVNLDKLGLTGSFSSAVVLRKLCGLISESVTASAHIVLEMPTVETFESDPGQAFDAFLATFRTALPGRVPFIMIDEFQDLLSAIARSGGGQNQQDTLVLDQLRGHMDDGTLNAVLTGSVRFDRLSNIVDHRIFGSLTRLRVSFLSEEGVSAVLSAGIREWAMLSPETSRRVYELTGGYPWLAQTYGAGLVDLLNREHRTVTTVEDVDYITSDAVLCNNELFEFWWPLEQLGAEEERFIEMFFRKYSSDQVVPIRDFFADINSREQPAFRRAFDNLRACEVLDSTQNEVLKFSGSVLRQWLEQQIQDGQLRMRKRVADPIVQRGQAGIFIDHENALKSLEKISLKRGLEVPTDKLDWFAAILKQLMLEAEKRVGPLSYKVTVAFWSRPHEARLLPAYFSHGFIPQQPEEIKQENAVDFKVADEVRRSREQAMRENTTLNRAIILCGDGDLSHATRALVNDGVAVQIWGGSRETGRKYADIVGEGNFVVLDDISGL